MNIPTVELALMRTGVSNWDVVDLFSARVTFLATTFHAESSV